MSQKWYQNAIVYALDVSSYCDADHNGIGDFQGLISRLPYLRDLGITCLWLLPFYASPNLDNGYAITNYYGIDNGLGTLDDFREFIRQAHEHDMHVLVDLVINHTSDQHFWFQDALNDPNSEYRSYYVWSKEAPKDMAPKVVFPGEQETNWTYHEVMDAYYWHYYYDFQPDLNYTNPQVRREAEKIIEFWLKFGVDGFRVDSLPMIISEKGLPKTKPPNGHHILKHLTSFMKMCNPDAIFLAEANVEPEEMVTYFGDGDEMDMLFNFYINSYFFLALARKEAEPLYRVWHQFSDMLTKGHWLNFIRTLDELSVERLTEAEQQEVFEAFAPDEEMQIYGRGIRRRVPPIVRNDRRLIELIYSFFFALPGTPMLVYGEEIGMGDDLSLHGRMSVRTSMQWDTSKNAGYSTAADNRLAHPVISSGTYQYKNINVEDQQDDPESLLNWMKALIQVRKSNPILGSAIPEVWDPKAENVFALHYRDDEQEILILHNLSSKAAGVKNLEVDWQDVFSDKRSRELKPASGTMKLAGYGYRWLCRAINTEDE